MNIFILNEVPQKAAQDLCDKHVVKMVLETAQILCSVFYNNSTVANIPYRLTHVNHPCCVWARKSKNNFEWLLYYFSCLLNEYKFRYHKIHKCTDIFTWVTQHKNELIFTDIKMTAFVQCVPDQYKTKNVITAYRNYYNAEKLKFAKWNYSKKPAWVKEQQAFCGKLENN